MDLQDRLDRTAAAYDRSADALITVRPFKHGTEDYVPGRVFEPTDITDDRLRLMISTKFVEVVSGAKGQVSDILPVVPAGLNLPLFVCAAPGCTRSFNTKLKLASHGKAHKD